jgi:hypothetical protein
VGHKVCIEKKKGEGTAVRRDGGEHWEALTIKV